MPEPSPSLSAIKDALSKINIDDLQIQYDKVTKGQLTKTRFSNLNHFKQAIDSIESLGLRFHFINLLKESEVYLTNYDSFSVEGLSGQGIIDSSYMLHSQIASILDFLNQTIKADPPEAIRIKIPESDDFQEMAVHLNDFKKAISIPILHPDVNGQVKILRGEPGSVLLVVWLGTLKACKMVAELCWSTMVIIQKKEEIERYKEHTRTLELENDYKEAILRAQQKQLDKFTEIEITGILDREDITPNPEYIQTLKMSINTLDHLFRKGAEIQPALGAPQDVIKQFPKMEKMYQIESKVKQIAEIATPEAEVKKTRKKKGVNP
ncbi:hypothetical protein [Dyadobacter bucti]|uniref:hypothetical protein n=1 Tax=Dyadobacter bucti TaxID=2572203 RepID=UPI001107CA4D|nr:hypothetical protein [Dyadobacter bucti]